MLIGQSAFGEAVFRALLEHREHVVGVFCPPDMEGRPTDPLKAAAEESGVAVHQFGRMRDQEAVEAFSGMSADLGVMAYVTDIVPSQILENPRKGHHPVPSIAASQASGSQLHKLGNHPGRRDYWTDHLLAR